MDIRLAKSAGFCFGVKKAVDTVYETIENENPPIYTFGPIIHNEMVTNDLDRRGVRVIKDEEELELMTDKDAVIIIRSHGVSKRIKELIEKKARKCIDATCPFVKRIHDLVEEKSREGYEIVILGSPDHPEVQGIVGWSSSRVVVVRDSEDAENYVPGECAGTFIVAQTTFNHKKFKDLVEIFEKKGYNSNVANTICHATQERQEEAAQIASSADAMLVIGDKGSSNTAKLAGICSELCDLTFFLQSAEDLPESFPPSVRCVGITAGASTPQYIIEEVYQHVGTHF